MAFKDPAPRKLRGIVCGRLSSVTWKWHVSRQSIFTTDSSLDEGNSGKDPNHARLPATQEAWAETTRVVPGLRHVGSKEPPTGCNQGSAPGKAGLQGDKAEEEEDLGEVGRQHPGCPCDSTAESLQPAPEFILLHPGHPQELRPHLSAGALGRTSAHSGDS